MRSPTDLVNSSFRIRIITTWELDIWGPLWTQPSVPSGRDDVSKLNAEEPSNTHRRFTVTTFLSVYSVIWFSLYKNLTLHVKVSTQRWNYRDI
ncbi:hypothetical protein WN55_10760 [Dufourea novaeangliae]|uniref:Uncharacterized protein n=1 Tax=Dufourea novaeangliae TaxID=178035 RepID=A0A154PBU5_DUFNO|nr:hypothetical protein WN55_10760 [Dufourea novaeangliae]